MEIVSRTGICKLPATGIHLDVLGAVNFDNTLNVKGVLTLDSTSTIEAAAGAGGDVTIGASSNTTIVNLGAGAHAKTINIGGTLDTVIIQGTVQTNNSTNTTIIDKLITLNKSGAVSSASDSGIEFEENAVITGYVKTSADRNSYTLKSPGRSGTLTLTPGSAAFALEISSSASANRTWSVPDVSDTFAGLAAAQIFTNKSITSGIFTGASNISGTVTSSAVSTYSGASTFNAAATFNSTVSFTGDVAGRGITPLGAVIATLSNLTGAYNCTATTAADANGYVQCNGQTISDGTSPLNGQTIPNINNSVFLRGATSSIGATGGSNANITLSTANLPSHAHDMGHGHSNSLALGYALTGTPKPSGSGRPLDQAGDYVDDYTDLGGFTQTGFESVAHTHTHSHQHDVFTPIYVAINASPGGSTYFAVTSTPTGSTAVGGLNISSGASVQHKHSMSEHLHRMDHYHNIQHGHTLTGSVTSFSGNTGNTGSGSSFAVLPSYIQVKYIIRIK